MKKRARRKESGANEGEGERKETIETAICPVNTDYVEILIPDRSTTSFGPIKECQLQRNFDWNFDEQAAITCSPRRTR